MAEWFPITLEPCVGYKKGILVTEPLDFIVAHHPQRGAVRIGLIWRHDGAAVQLSRFFKQEIRTLIQKRVTELRKAVTDNRVADRPSSIPDPRLIAAFLKGERFRKRKTQVSGGMPSGKGKQNERQRLYVPGRD
jgi:hypothetical protein